MALEIEVHGLKELMRDLGSLRVFQILRPHMIRSMAGAVNRMADYPPKPEGSTYRRQGTLGRRWTQTQPTVSERTTELEVKVGNNTIYGPWVQDKQFQARMHVGRWQTDEDVMGAIAPRVTADLNAAVQQALDEVGA